MDLQSLGSLGELIGGIAVVVSLIYLAIQIRHNTRAVKTAAYQWVTDARVSFLDSVIANGEISQLYVSGLANREDLPTADRARFDLLMYRLFAAMENFFYQHRESVMEQETWERQLATIRFFLTQPGVQSWWKRKPVPVTERFSDFLEEQLRDLPG